MKKGIYILLLIAVHFSFVADEPSIVWKNSHRLSWNDFRGTPGNADEVAAITASGIAYDLSATMAGAEVQVKCNVTAYFYPERSWYKKELADSVVLAHEQLHFDITELHARKLRSAVKKTVFTRNVKQEMKALYEVVNRELDAYQRQYDTATDYSRNIEQQSEWGKKVARDLRKFE